jgi:anti-repressor protein|nr:MAG TPA: KilAC domain protein [Caudoviricetes sp.]
MKDLVFKGESNEVLTNSLLVAEKFGKDHKRVLQDIRDLKCSNQFRQHNFVLSSYYSDQNRELPMYVMNKDGFTLLVMGYTGETAMKFKEDYIEAFNKMEETIKNGGFNVPKSFREALLLAAEQQAQIEQQQMRIEEMKPKEEFFDQVTDSKDACDMATVAKVLNMGVGRNKLFEILRDKKVLQERNAPYQSYIDRGWFRVIESKYTKPNGDMCINYKTIVYQKGVDGIRKILLELKDAGE